MHPERPRPPRAQDLDAILGDTDSDLVALVELQQFLAEEIVGAMGPDSQVDLTSAFVPLTDGLGLDSPTEERKRVAPSAISLIGTTASTPRVLAGLMPEATSPYTTFPEVGVPSVTDLRRTEWEDETPKETVPAAEPAALVEEAAPRPTLSEIVGDRTDLPTKSVAVPPPLPQVSALRRMFAGMFDIVFVLALWAFLVVATSRILGDPSQDVLTQLAANFSRRGFLRLVGYEYLGLWSLYFLICQGALDTTLGMWVWGVRVSFGERVGWATYASHKFMRMIASILFFAPIAPLLVLVVRIRGRNLLDWISGTSLYRSQI